MRYPQASLFGLFSTLALSTPTPQDLHPRSISHLTIFTPPPDYTQPGTLYAGTLLLSTGTILATWENYSPYPSTPYFPIFRSTDNGSTWTEISRVTDTVNNQGLRYQPFLYELPTPIGAFSAGTILCAGNSIPSNIGSTSIDLYASTDGGTTWAFASHIADGNGAPTGAANANVWEPFIMTYNNYLVLYYSDQRDPSHNQKLVHVTSSDGITWSEQVDDVVSPALNAAPGMATVAKLPNEQYIMTYEVGDDPEFAVYYRLSADPTAFASAPEIALISSEGIVSHSSPYVVWSPYGGESGTIVVNSYSDTGLFVNQALGESGAWKTVATPQPKAYSRILMLMGDRNEIMVCGGGVLANPVTFGSAEPHNLGNRVSCSVVDPAEALS